MVGAFGRASRGTSAARPWGRWDERVVRGHYAVGFRWVGSREKNHEWTRISSIHEAVPLILCVFRGLNCFNIFRVHSCAFVVQKRPAAKYLLLPHPSPLPHEK